MYEFLKETLCSINSQLDSGWLRISNAYLAYLETSFNNNDMIAFMVTMYIIHNVIAFVYSTVNIAMHYFQVCLNYKIRPTDDNDYKLVRLAFLDLVKRLFTSIPMWYILYYLLYYSGCRFLEPFPSKEESLRQFLLMLVTTDTAYYWMHRWMHEVPWMYKIHKVHHEFKATSAVTTLYAHPLETLFGTFGTTLLGAILFCPHGAIFCIYYTLRLIEAYEVHSGYIFPFSIINSWNMIFFGADRHDFHHSHNVGCYGTWTCLWDSLLGTDEYYNRWKRKKELLKKKETEVETLQVAKTNGSDDSSCDNDSKIQKEEEKEEQKVTPSFIGKEGEGKEEENNTLLCENNDDNNDVDSKKYKRLHSRRHSKTFYDEYFGTDMHPEEVEENNKLIKEIEEELSKEKKENRQRQYERRDSLRQSINTFIQGMTNCHNMTLKRDEDDDDDSTDSCCSSQDSSFMDDSAALLSFNLDDEAEKA